MWPTGTYASNLGTFTALLKVYYPFQFPVHCSQIQWHYKIRHFSRCLMYQPVTNKTLANTTVAFSLKVIPFVFMLKLQQILIQLLLFKCRAFIGGTFTKPIDCFIRLVLRPNFHVKVYYQHICQFTV